jgi:diguanylate cyclase (GGDEF)-like protein
MIHGTCLRPHEPHGLPEDPLYVVDPQRRIQYWNEAATRLTRYRATDVLGRLCPDGVLQHVDERGRSICQSDCPLLGTLADGEPRETKGTVRDRDGRPIAVDLRCAALLGPQGETVGAVHALWPTSSRIAPRPRSRELQELVQIDPVTGLANRRQFDLVLASRLRALARRGAVFGQLEARIENYREIDGAWGEGAGDRLLRAIARALAHEVRDGDALARIDEDAFAILAPGLDSESLERLGARLMAQIEKVQIPANGGEVAWCVDLGGALALPTDTAETLAVRIERALDESRQLRRFRGAPAGCPA